MKYGKLTIIETYSKDCGKRKRRFAKCICDCGNITIAEEYIVKTGITKSCGCLQKEIIKNILKKHGMSSTRIYRVYAGINTRCNDINHKSYKRYGGRGIKNEWINFDEFNQDMGEAYNLHCKEHGEKNTTIDRIDNNGNYCKDNCRWATYIVQQHSRKDGLFFYKGENISLKKLATMLGINGNTLSTRFQRHGDINYVLSNYYNINIRLGKQQHIEQ